MQNEKQQRRTNQMNTGKLTKKMIWGECDIKSKYGWITINGQNPAPTCRPRNSSDSLRVAAGSTEESEPLVEQVHLIIVGGAVHKRFVIRCLECRGVATDFFPQEEVWFVVLNVYRIGKYYSYRRRSCNFHQVERNLILLLNLTNVGYFFVGVLGEQLIP